MKSAASIVHEMVLLLSTSLVLLSCNHATLVDGFVPVIGTKNAAANRSPLSSSASSKNEVDVSDLGLTMEDLEAPLPAEFWQGVETSGYESTSRITTVKDDACFWTETQNEMQVTLTIPGLRGQPALALAGETATNTLSITAFGMVVWSCILKGSVKPETATFEAKEVPDMIPIVEYSVQKADDTKRWGGFIEQIGENSIL